MDIGSFSRKDIVSLAESLEQANEISKKKTGGDAQLVFRQGVTSIRPAGRETPESRILNEQSRLAIMSGLASSETLSRTAIHNVGTALFGGIGANVDEMKCKPITARTLKLVDLGISMGQHGKPGDFSDFIASAEEFSSKLATTFAQKFTENVYGTVYERLTNDYVDEALNLIKEKGDSVLSDFNDFSRMLENRVFAKNVAFLEAMDKASKLMTSAEELKILDVAVDRTGLPDSTKDRLKVRYQSMVKESLARQITEGGGIGSPSGAVMAAEADVVKFNNILVQIVRDLETAFVKSGVKAGLDTLPHELQKTLEDMIGDDLQLRVTREYEENGADEGKVKKMVFGYLDDPGLVKSYKDSLGSALTAYAEAVSGLESMLDSVPEEARPMDMEAFRGKALKLLQSKMCAGFEQKGLGQPFKQLVDAVLKDVTGEYGAIFENPKICLDLKKGAGDLVDSVKIAVDSREVPLMKHLKDAPFLKEKLTRWVENHYTGRLQDLNTNAAKSEEGDAKNLMNPEVEKKYAAEGLVEVCKSLLDDVARLETYREKILGSLASGEKLRARISAAFDDLLAAQLNLSDEKGLSLRFNDQDVGSVEKLAECFKIALSNRFAIDSFHEGDLEVVFAGPNPPGGRGRTREAEDASVRFRPARKALSLDDGDRKAMNSHAKAEDLSFEALADAEKKAMKDRRAELTKIFDEDVVALTGIPEAERKNYGEALKGDLAKLDKARISLLGKEEVPDVNNPREIVERPLSDFEVAARFVNPNLSDANCLTRPLAMAWRFLGTLRLHALAADDSPLAGKLPDGMKDSIRAVFNPISSAFSAMINLPVRYGYGVSVQYLAYADVYRKGVLKLADSPEVKALAVEFRAALDVFDAAAEKATGDEKIPEETFAGLLEVADRLGKYLNDKVGKIGENALVTTFETRFSSQQRVLLERFSPGEIAMDVVTTRLRTLGLSAQEALGMPVERLEKYVLVKYAGNSIENASDLAYADMLRRFKDGSLPLMDMTHNRLYLMKRLLEMKTKPSGGKGFDTVDAYSVYSAIAKNGLLNGVLDDPKMNDEAVENLCTVLSLLYPLNFSSTDNLVVLGERLLGMDVCDFAQKVAAKDVSAVALFDQLKGGKLKNPLETVAVSAKPALTFFKTGGSVAEFLSAAKIADVKNASGDLLGSLHQLELKAKTAKAGEIASVEVRIGDVPVRLEVKNGLFRAAFTVGGKWCPQECPFDVGTFADRVAKEIVANPSVFGTDIAMDVLKSAVGDGGQAELLRARDLALAIIRSQTGFPVAKLSHLGSANLCQLADDLLRALSVGEADVTKKPSKAALAEMVSTAAAVVDLHLNSADVVELCAQVESVGEAADAAVTISNDVKRVTKNVDPVREFAAELFQSVQAWRDDLPGLSDEARLMSALKKNIDTLSRISADPTLIASFVCGPAGYRDESLANAMKLVLHSLCAACGKPAGSKLTGSEVAQALDNENFIRDWNTSLKGSVYAAQASCVATLQRLFGEKFANGLSTSAKLKGSLDMLTLRQLAGADSFDVEQGYGKFLKSAFDNYFRNLSGVDGKAFFASVLRQTGPDADQLTVMTAMVKAAGPVFQKLIQGVPMNAVPEPLRPIVECSKSSLSSIPSEIVKAKLYSLVKRSNGRILSIEVKKSLGAASVGEALLCVIKTKDNPFGEECVVKMLRPDVQSRSRREYAMLSEIAASVDETGSMKAAFDGRFTGILDELDFTVEADNIELGRVYRPDAVPNAPQGVTSMSSHALASQTSDLLILKKAEGTTYERYVRLTNETVDRIADRFRTETKDPTGKVTAVSFTKGSALEMLVARGKLTAIYRDMLARQKALIDFSSRWTEEAIFNSGVFHGDLHGGNIMTSERLLTAIDFGNVSKLTQDERDNLMGIIAACAINSPATLVDYYESLLSPEGKARLKTPAGEANFKTFKDNVAAVLAKGGVGDSALRLSAVIRQLEILGFEVPSSLFNFSQSLTRLEETIVSVNITLQRVKAMLSDIKTDASLYDQDGLNTKNPIDATMKAFRLFDEFNSEERDPDSDVSEWIHEKLTEGNAPYSEKTLAGVVRRQLNSKEDFDQMVGWLDDVFFPVDPDTGARDGSIVTDKVFANVFSDFTSNRKCFADDAVKDGFSRNLAKSLKYFITTQVVQSVVDNGQIARLNDPQDYGEALNILVGSHEVDIGKRKPGLLKAGVAFKLSKDSDTAERIADDLKAADVAAGKWVAGQNTLTFYDAERIKVAVRELLTLNDNEFVKGGFSIFSSNWSNDNSKRASLLKKLDANLKWLDKRLPQLGFPAGDGNYEKAVRDFAIYYMGQRNGINISFGVNNSESFENLTDGNFNLLVKEAEDLAVAGTVDTRVVDVLRSWRADALRPQVNAA